LQDQELQNMVEVQFRQQEITKMKYYSFSHKGRRDTNQDFVLCRDIHPSVLLCLVVDGMGGYQHGLMAATMVAENIDTYLSAIQNVDNKQIQMSINKANLAIKQKSKDLGEKMGATVAGMIVSENLARCFWVGDVKIYHFREQELLFESMPHTLMEEVKKNGNITDVEKISKYRHVVTRSVYGGKIPETEFFELTNLTKGDILVICSDGVHDTLDGHRVQRMISQSGSLEKAIAGIQDYLKTSARDNYSMVVVEV